jgi:hypothetical protein
VGNAKVYPSGRNVLRKTDSFRRIRASDGGIMRSMTKEAGGDSCEGDLGEEGSGSGESMFTTWDLA